MPLRHRLSCAAICAVATLAAVPSAAAGKTRSLPLGPKDLQERRTTTRVAEGLTWTQIVRGRPNKSPGPWVVNVLAVSRRLFDGRVTAVLSNDQVQGRETTTGMGVRTGALAGVNGGFFVSAGSANGDPVGALAIDGEVVSESIDGRTSLLLPESIARRPRLTTLRFRGSVEIGGRSRLIDGVNRFRGRIANCGGRGGDTPTKYPRHAFTCDDPSELILFTPRFGPRTPPGRDGVEAVVENGEITRIAFGGETTIPRDGYVLSGSGDAEDYVADAVGSKPDVRTPFLSGGSSLSAGDHEAIVSGGPKLVSRGKVRIRSVSEGFGPKGNPGIYRSFVLGRNPRTMAGVTAGGRLLLVTVDGRRPGHSIGVSLGEGAAVMRALGAREALNLDGGGSSAMTVGGRTVNRPSDAGGERPVAEGIFVLPSSAG
jgi:exopolysaccharide biosynthesis protein